MPFFSKGYFAGQRNMAVGYSGLIDIKEINEISSDMILPFVVHDIKKQTDTRCVFSTSKDIVKTLLNVISRVKATLTEPHVKYRSEDCV